MGGRGSSGGGGSKGGGVKVGQRVTVDHGKYGRVTGFVNHVNANGSFKLRDVHAPDYERMPPANTTYRR